MLKFRAVGMIMGVQIEAARFGRWHFVIGNDHGHWSTSYRLIDPTVAVSASSTMRGPFASRREAIKAANDMVAELRRLS